jgi:L-ascorbate metabolism protein UlaG (beta-lactamase superfamily)
MNHMATVTRIGGPTVLLEVGGVRLLTDPTFDPAGSTYQVGPVVLTKTRGPALGIDDLGDVDAVLLTHDQHPDNLDHAGRAYLGGVPAIFTTPSGAERLGAPAVGLRPGEAAVVTSARGSVQVTATRAVHGSEPVAAALGEVTGFLVTLLDSGAAVYISGDNVAAASYAEAGRRADVHLAIVHAGAAQLPMFGSELLTPTAAGVRAAARALPSARLLVVHEDGWSHLTEGASEIEHTLTPQLGERLLNPRMPAGTTVGLPLTP